MEDLSLDKLTNLKYDNSQNAVVKDVSDDENESISCSDC